MNVSCNKKDIRPFTAFAVPAVKTFIGILGGAMTPVQCGWHFDSGGFEILIPDGDPVVGISGDPFAVA